MSIELGVFIFLVVYKLGKKLMDCWEARIPNWEPNKELDELELCAPRHKKKGGVVRGSFNTLLQPGLRESFTQPGTVDNNINIYYPGKVIFVDGDIQKILWPKREPTAETYGDEYWRILKEKLRREREDE